MTKINGTTKTISIVVITFIALGGLVWGFSGRASTLETCTTDVVVLKDSVQQIKTSVNNINTTVAVMQNDMGHIKDDIKDILTLQRLSLNIPENISVGR